MGKPPPTGRTLSALFIEQTRARPDAVFIAHGLDEKSSFTFAEIERRALRIAGALKNVLPNALGTRALSKDEPRPRAALLLPNGPEFVASFFGAILAGCPVLPIDPRLRPGEIRFLLEHGGAAALLTTPSALSPDLRPTCPVLDAESLSAEPDPSQEKQISPNSPNNLEFEDPFDDASEPAVLLGTSGSTSTPKAVLLSHRSLLANARAFCERYRVEETDVLATVLSLCHSFGMTACLLAALLTGASVATADEPLPARVAALCSRRGASIFLAAASFYQYLVRSEACSPAHFARVRHFIAGACSLPIEIVNRFQQKFALPILQTYGLTEASPVVTANPPEQNRPGTVGPPLAGVEIRLLNEGDEGEIPRGSAIAGELCVRGELVMNGYDKNPEATARCLSADGWLRTGDLARIDEAGYVILLGRSKDLIVRAGEKIYPEEVEEALHRHAGVAEAAVVGAPDPVFEEVPVAFVVPAGAPLDGADLRAHCVDQLAAYKVPRRFVFIDKLPRNPNGKVLKKALREMLSSQPQQLPSPMPDSSMDTEAQGGPRGQANR